MRPGWLALAALALAVHVHAASAADPVIQVDFSNPGLSPPQWTLTLRSDGSGHFRSQMGKTPDNGWKEMETPAVDRDIQVSAQFAGRVFDAAQRHTWFNEPCESHLKVAFEGWKTLTYTGPKAHGSCTFNYSRDKEIETLGDSLVAVAETILEGARLELLLQHDRLGLDQEMEFLDRGCCGRPGAADLCHSRHSGAPGAGRRSPGAGAKAGQRPVVAWININVCVQATFWRQFVSNVCGAPDESVTVAVRR